LTNLKEIDIVSFNEWQLLCTHQDIEPGDTLEVEHLYEKKKKALVFVGLSPKEDWIFCQDQNRKPFVFNSLSLDQKGKRTKQWRIAGKSSEELRLKPKRIRKKAE
jgi:hypothetical protein